MMIPKLKTIFTFIFLSLLILTPLSVNAVEDINELEYVELVELPDLRPAADQGGEQNAIDYIEKVYYFILTISALLAVVMLVIAGVEYTTYGANEAAINDAKSRITYAIVGLILALSSWLILYIVNPKLVGEGGDIFSPTLSKLGSADGSTTKRGDLPSLCYDGKYNRIYGEWGNPCDPLYESQNIVSVTAGGVNFRVHRLVAEKFVNFINDLEAGGYDVTRIDGYNFRLISGSTSLSNHSFGAAIDIDPDRNQFYNNPEGGPFALPANVGDLAQQYGLTWGGDYNSIKDYMHFEEATAPSSP